MKTFSAAMAAAFCLGGATLAAAGAAAQAQTPASPARSLAAIALQQPGASASIPPASLHGARIFIKYSLQYYPATKTVFDHLILFPSGAAFADLPLKHMAQFDEQTLKALLKPYDIGTWKQSGNTITLSFPDKSSDKVRTLRKVAKGWYDGTKAPEPGSAYDIYYPVVPLTPKVLAGPWVSKTLITLGMEGGGAAMVAAGSTGSRVFFKDGTYSDDRETFSSATTANMPGMYKGSGDVYQTNSGKTSESGLWRIDGPLLTLQKGKDRLVLVAFAMPNWGPADKPDVMIDGDRWKRPEKK